MWGSDKNVNVLSIDFTEKLETHIKMKNILFWTSHRVSATSVISALLIRHMKTNQVNSIIADYHITF